MTIDKAGLTTGVLGICAGWPLLSTGRTTTGTIGSRTMGVMTGVSGTGVEGTAEMGVVISGITPITTGGETGDSVLVGASMGATIFDTTGAALVVGGES